MNPLPIITKTTCHLLNPSPYGCEEGLESKIFPHPPPEVLIKHQGGEMTDLNPNGVKQHSYPNKQQPHNSSPGSCPTSCHLPHPMGALYTEAIPVSLMNTIQAFEGEGVFPDGISVYLPAMASPSTFEVGSYNNYLDPLLLRAAFEGVSLDSHPLIFYQLLYPFGLSCSHQERDILPLEVLYHIYAEKLPIKVEAFYPPSHLPKEVDQSLNYFPLAHPSLYHNQSEGISLLILYHVDRGELIKLARSFLRLGVDDELPLLRGEFALIYPCRDKLEVNSYLPFNLEDRFGDDGCQGLVEVEDQSVNIQGVEFVEDGVRMRGTLKLFGCLLDGFPLCCCVAECGEDLPWGVQGALRPLKLEPFLESIESDVGYILLEEVAWGAHVNHLLLIWFLVCPTLFNVHSDFWIILILSHCDLLIIST